MNILNKLLKIAVIGVLFTVFSNVGFAQTGTPSSTNPKVSNTMPHGPSSPHDIVGQVEGGGGPIAKATVTLWAAGSGAPEKLAETQTKDDGGFDLKSAGGNHGSGVLFLIAEGGEPKVAGDKGPNPAITLMATLGTTPPMRVTINELTTVASVWTGAQFLKGAVLSGPTLGLNIASGNVPNLVDLTTGGLGSVIQDP